MTRCTKEIVGLVNGKMISNYTLFEVFRRYVNVIVLGRSVE